MKPTGRIHDKYSHWVEWEETPAYHATGYFWLRKDGLRFGYRVAGTYYREGTTPQPVDQPFHPLDYPAGHPKRGEGQWWPSGSYFDGALAFDVIGSMREKGKQEQFPAHLRVIQDGRVLEYISKIDGVDLEVILDKENFDVFAFIDKRFPLDKTIDAKTDEVVVKKSKK